MDKKGGAKLARLMTTRPLTAQGILEDFRVFSAFNPTPEGDLAFVRTKLTQLRKAEAGTVPSASVGQALVAMSGLINFDLGWSSGTDDVAERLFRDMVKYAEATGNSNAVAPMTALFTRHLIFQCKVAEAFRARIAEKLRGRSEFKMWKMPLLELFKGLIADSKKAVDLQRWPLHTLFDWAAATPQEDNFDEDVYHLVSFLSTSSGPLQAEAVKLFYRFSSASVKEGAELGLRMEIKDEYHKGARKDPQAYSDNAVIDALRRQRRFERGQDDYDYLDPAWWDNLR